MSSPLIIRSYNQDQYVLMLESVYRAGWRVPDPEFATAQDADIWEKIRRDPDISAAINTRVHSVAARHWTMKLPGKADENEQLLGAICEDGLKSIEKFTSSRATLALATIRGSSWGYVTWGTKFTRLGPAGTPRGRWVCPLRIRDVDRRRFRYGIRRYMDPEQGREVVDVPLEMRDTEEQVWRRVEDRTPLITVCFQDEEARLGFGRGLIEALYFYHFLKGRLLEEGMQAIERLAQGLLVLSIDGLREADYQRNNQVVQQAVIEALKKFRSKHVLVKDKADELELKETTGAGSQMVLDFLHELNRAMRVLILGSDLPFGGDRSKGSTEVADQQAAVSAELIDFDRELMDEAVTKYIVQKFIWYNRQNLAKMGLLGVRTPSFQTIQEKRMDPEVAANVFSILHGAGVSVRRDELAQYTNYSVPVEGDDVIEGTEEPSMDDMFGGGGFGEDGGDGEEGDGAEGADKGKSPFGKPPGGKPGAQPPKKGLPPFKNWRRAFVMQAMAAYQQPREAPAPIVVQAAPPAPIHMHVAMPDLPDVAAAKLREGVLREELEESRIKFSEAMERPIHVHVAAPRVRVSPPQVHVNVEQPAAPNISVAAPIVNVEAPHVTVQAPPPAQITVNVPKPAQRHFEFHYGKDGRIETADSEPKA